MRLGGAAAGRVPAIPIAFLVLTHACVSQRPVGVTPPALKSANTAAVVEPYDWRLPAGFPEPEVPPDNPMSAAKVDLGRRLFYDRRLSGNGHLACSSCHRQELAFTDGLGQAVGSTGEVHPRGSMSLTNVAYNATYNWADPTMTRLEDQALNPMLNENPIELGMAGMEEEVFERLRNDDSLVELFAQAFPSETISLGTLTRAIAAFERTLISGNAPYDRYLFWDEPLPDPAARGMVLFFSERTGCFRCHAGLNLSGPVRAKDSVVDSMNAPTDEPSSGELQSGFHNTGLFDEDGAGAYPEPNRGVFEITGRAEDMGRFRAPTLRNVEVTAPYMHDGSFATLEEVVRFYVDGGRGPGRSSPLKSRLVSGLDIDLREEGDLVAFLKALTDRSFLTDQRFADPDLADPGLADPGESG